MHASNRRGGRASGCSGCSGDDDAGTTGCLVFCSDVTTSSLRSRCPRTSSGGLSASHRLSETSGNSEPGNNSRKCRVASPVFSMLWPIANGTKPTSPARKSKVRASPRRAEHARPRLSRDGGLPRVGVRMPVKLARAAAVEPQVDAGHRFGDAQSPSRWSGASSRHRSGACGCRRTTSGDWAAAVIGDRRVDHVGSLAARIGSSGPGSVRLQRGRRGDVVRPAIPGRDDQRHARLQMSGGNQ